MTLIDSLASDIASHCRMGYLQAEGRAALCALIDHLEEWGGDSAPWRLLLAGEAEGIASESSLEVVQSDPDGDWCGILATLPLPPAEGEVALDARQLAASLAFARAHGHQWGGIEPLLDAAMSPRQIEAETYRRTSPGACGWGIVAPDLIGPGTHPLLDPEMEGWTFHETASGRSSWAVAPQAAEIRLWVDRPAGTVLRMSVREDGSFRVGRESPGVLLWERHAAEMAGLARIAAEAMGLEADAMSEEVRAIIARMHPVPEIVGTDADGTPWTLAGEPIPAPRIIRLHWSRIRIGEEADLVVEDAHGGTARMGDTEAAGRTVALLLQDPSLSAGAAMLISRRRTESAA